jgi:hypothetical protein
MDHDISETKVREPRQVGGLKEANLYVERGRVCEKFYCFVNLSLFHTQKYGANRIVGGLLSRDLDLAFASSNFN